MLQIPNKKDKSTDEIYFFSEEILQILLEQPNTSISKGIRNLMFMILVNDTGCRIQEMLNLKLNNLHLNDECPYIIVTGKGSKVRLVPSMEKTIEH